MYIELFELDLSMTSWKTQLVQKGIKEQIWGNELFHSFKMKINKAEKNICV